MKNLIVCIFLLLSIEVQSETFSIATGEFAPYCSSTAKYKGFANHVVSKAFARQGHQVEFDFLPWKRAYLQSKNGDYDASSWWSYNEERAGDFLYSDELLKANNHFFM